VPVLSWEQLRQILPQLAARTVVLRGVVCREVLSAVVFCCFARRGFCAELRNGLCGLD